jgi:hypothetical protein
MRDKPLADTQVAAAADIEVFDARGNRIRFGALFELERTVVIFISGSSYGRFILCTNGL